MKNLPKQMRYIQIERFGGPEVLKIKTKSIPEPSKNEVLIKVKAAGVNRPDVMQRKGFYPPPPGASNIPGLEISGKIVRLGKNVNKGLLNSNVCALVTSGGYAEYCLAASSLCLPIPKKLSIIEASGLPETFFTVWTNVFERGKLKQGETFLVHGGSSGIGTTAIQLAKAFGAIVLTTAGTYEKCKFCETLGADFTINYREKDFFKEIKNLTKDRGVNLILDMVGGTYFKKNINLLAENGKLVQIALIQGKRSEVDLLPLLLKRLTLSGSTLRPRSVREKTKIANALRKKVWPLIEESIVRPVIHKVFQLEHANQAHHLMETSSHIGKILLKTDANT